MGVRAQRRPRGARRHAPSPTAAGANLGAITYHFGSKDALLAEAVGAAIEALVEPALDALRDEALDPAGRLLEAVARLQRGVRRERRRRARVPRGAARQPAAPGVARGTSRRCSHASGRCSTTVITDLQAKQALPDWVAPAPMAGLLLAVAQGVVLQTTIDGAGPASAAMADQFAAVARSRASLVGATAVSEFSAPGLTCPQHCRSSQPWR